MLKNVYSKSKNKVDEANRKEARAVLQNVYSKSKDKIKKLESKDRGETFDVPKAKQGTIDNNRKEARAFLQNIYTKSINKIDEDKEMVPAVINDDEPLPQQATKKQKRTATPSGDIPAALRNLINKIDILYKNNKITDDADRAFIENIQANNFEMYTTAQRSSKTIFLNNLRRIYKTFTPVKYEKIREGKWAKKQVRTEKERSSPKASSSKTRSPKASSSKARSSNQ